jgi:Ca-activated chloride channel homolog
MVSLLSPRRGPAAALAVLVVAFGLSWSGTPATATPRTEDESGTGRMMIVLDSSGSMKERAAGGETKIVAAKRALGTVIGSLPESQPVGLRVYGATVFSRDDAGACTDSQLVVPVDTGNRADLRTAVRSYKPYGETPIGYALQQAAEDLGAEGRRTIVLVSDGEPTCDPDPCQVARELTKQGVELKVDVVGLDVAGAARAKLQCIAGAGNGTYYDVDSSEEFAASLEKLATRAARPFTAIGAPVAGTPTADGAPEVTAGDWLDEIGASADDRVKTYLVSREIPGSTLHVSASLRTAASSGETVDLTLATAEGQRCDADSAFTQLSAGQLISAGADAGSATTTGGLDRDDPCVAADTLVATVTDSATQSPGPRPLEVRVIEEPPVDAVDGLPPAVTSAEFVSPPKGRPARTTGGSSFGDAPVLDPGTYHDAILPGEVLTYQVDLDWGQQVAARVDFAKPGAKLASATGNLDMFTRVDVFGPGRRLASNNALSGTPTSQAYLPISALTTGIGASPVTFLNRTASGVAQGASLAGRYTVTVFLEEDPQGESYLVPFTLRLGVTGAVAGAPAYTEEPAAVESASAPQSPTPAPEEDQDTPSAGSTDGGGLDGGLVVGGLGVLALVAAGIVVARSRRVTP